MFGTSAAHEASMVQEEPKQVQVSTLTGEVRMAELLIAVLGASNLTYADASWTQRLPDRIGAHIRMFRFFDSAPRNMARYVGAAAMLPQSDRTSLAIQALARSATISGFCRSSAG